MKFENVELSKKHLYMKAILLEKDVIHCELHNDSDPKAQTNRAQTRTSPALSEPSVRNVMINCVQFFYLFRL